MVKLEQLKEKLLEVNSSIENSLTQIRETEAVINQMHANHNALIGKKIAIEELMDFAHKSQEENL